MHSLHLIADAFADLVRLMSFLFNLQKLWQCCKLVEKAWMHLKLLDWIFLSMSFRTLLYGKRTVS